MIKGRHVATEDQWRMEHRVGEGAVILIPWRLLKCSKCKTWMLPERIVIDIYGSFEWKAAQKRLGLVEQWLGPQGDDIVCVPCAKAGGATFKCVLCKERREIDAEQERFGDPPERLGVPCYETVPAKTWEAKVKSLHESHRYDWE